MRGSSTFFINKKTIAQFWSVFPYRGMCPNKCIFFIPKETMGQIRSYCILMTLFHRFQRKILISLHQSTPVPKWKSCCYLQYELVQTSHLCVKIQSIKEEDEIIHHIQPKDWFLSLPFHHSRPSIPNFFQLLEKNILQPSRSLIH